ncbi:MAG: putative ADNP homeobox protein 2 [Streblomastix strix]|uniref:Putative ADNP homeobox protein 2 n=1 Tax=Streblomastix strix TaxID=222440 RepID=A0A5J4URX8_9EUKA|nr:MAG: putative ADNP homeobox protein 2 [Streblomastix strix]
MEYCNMLTLDVIAQQSDFSLPTYTLRALMKQILEGMRAFHSSGFIHRDIKCDNILLHSPPGSGRVYAKISDFGFAKKDDQIGGQTYLKGTVPFFAPEMFQFPTELSQKVDIYAIGITFYKLLTHKYPVNEGNYEAQRKCEDDPDERITAAEALQHPYFTSPEALADISKEQQDLASLAAVAEIEEDSNITEFDKDPSFIVAESIIKKFILENIHLQQPQQQINIQQIKLKMKPLMKEENQIICDKMMETSKLSRQNNQLIQPSTIFSNTQSSSTSEVLSNTQLSSSEVHPCTQSSSSEVYPSAQSSSSEVYPSAQSSSSEVYPSAQSSSSEVYPNTQSQSSEVHPCTQSSSSEVYPSAQLSSSEVYPISQSSSEVYPNTQSQSSEVHPCTQSSSSEVYPSAQSSSEVYPSAQSSSEVYPNTQSQSSEVHPCTQSSSSEVYPSAQSSSEVYPNTQSQSSEVHPCTQSSSSEVYPSAQSSSEVYPNTQSQSSEVHPSTQSSSSEVHLNVQSQSSEVHPSTQLSSQEVYPSAQSSSSKIYPSTQSSSSEVYPNTQSSSSKVLSCSQSSSSSEIHPAITFKIEVQISLIIIYCNKRIIVSRNIFALLKYDFGRNQKEI